MTWTTKTELYPHQQVAVDKLLPGRVGGLFMDMGTGKTRAAIELIARRRHRIRRAIVYCPVSLKETWRAEIAKHTTCSPSAIYVFNEKTTTRTLPRAFWYIIGIESMSSSNRVVLAAARLTTTETAVIVDESSYIKGHSSLRTLRITRLSEPARYRLILTGTPISQGVEDLFAQMRFLSPKILGYGSFYSFAANHLEYSEQYPGMVIRTHNTAWLASRVQPYVYQVTKEEAGINLPAKLYDRRYCRLTRDQTTAYEQAKYEILLETPPEEFDSYIIFRLFGVLQQIASGFRHFPETGRLEEYPSERPKQLLDVLAAIGYDKKVIIWCKYRYSVRRVVATLTDAYGAPAVAEYHGGLPEEGRAAEEARWKGEGDCRFLVATMQTGGYGHNWADAAYAIFYENEFKYASRIQAEDRCYRLGQTIRPTYVDIIADCGIEDRIMKSLAKKSNAVHDFRRKVDRLKKLKGKKDLREAVAAML